MHFPDLGVYCDWSTLQSADVSGEGTLDEPLRTSAWRVICHADLCGSLWIHNLRYLLVSACIVTLKRFSGILTTIHTYLSEGWRTGSPAKISLSSASWTNVLKKITWREFRPGEILAGLGIPACAPLEFWMWNTFPLNTDIAFVRVIAWFVVIFGINTTSDISKLLYVISRAVRRVKFETILKYHEWYLCQISRTNHAIICLYYYPQKVCNFHM